jgi:thiamine monophosphate synthase
MNRIDLFKRDLNAKKAVKIIAGISNFDMGNIKKVITAANSANASAIDICSKKEIIEQARQLTDLPLFVSSVVPEELAEAVKMGADAIELGNFDIMYKSGSRISAEEVLNLTKRTLSLIDKSSTFMCVTIPGHISVSEQIDLARELEALDIDLIQTEGAATVADSSKHEGARGLVETAQVSISNTIEIARNVSVPVMTASGITPTTAAMAFAAGASAIGVGSCINKLESELSMIATAKSLVEIANRSVSKETVMA